MRRVVPMALALVLLGLGCSEPRAVPIIGPDGSHMFHVSCGNREADCYRLAGERCPYGYDVGRTIAGAGNMLVRCRAPMAQPVYPAAQYRAPAAVPLNTYAAAAQPPQPAAPPLRAASPAPSASTPVPASSARRLPHPASPYGDVDFGY